MIGIDVASPPAAINHGVRKPKARIWLLKTFIYLPVPQLFSQPRSHETKIHRNICLRYSAAYPPLGLAPAVRGPAASPPRPSFHIPAKCTASLPPDLSHPTPHV